MENTRIKSCYKNGLVITINRIEKSPFRKVNTPQEDIFCHTIRTKEYELGFNLKGEIKMIKGLGMNWPHPYSWLIRSDGNDWVYYKTGSMEKRKIVDFTGENYLPCLTYKSNQIFEFNPYTDPAIAGAFAEWSMVYGNLYEGDFTDLDQDFQDFIKLVTENGENRLHESSKELNSITGGKISVLPPDTRHVNYEVIPLMISEGCIYNCKFCWVKSEKGYDTFSKEKIDDAIGKLKKFYGENLINYSGIFLGDHDALFAGIETIKYAAEKAFDEFGFKRIKTIPKLFLFGSVKSFTKAESFIEKINALPFYTYINIGFESVDKETLKSIGKPLSPSENMEVFGKIVEYNKIFSNIEITGNFILGEDLSEAHDSKIIEMLSGVKEKTKKGGIYFSPLVKNLNRLYALDKFFEIKKEINGRYPVYIYLIQRL